MRIQNYINGQFVAPANGRYFDNVAPASGEVYGTIPESGSEDVNRAIEAAKKAFPLWSALTAAQRSTHMMQVAQRIEERLDELAAAESKDNGKPLKLATRVDIPRARDNFAFYATAILHEASETHDMGAQGFNYTLRRPIGVVACISPWNLPLYLFTWKIAPALAAGNTVVAKPSEVTPATAYLLSQILDEVGFPAGVLNIVHGTGPAVGEPLVSHPEVPVISFTGGTATGARISQIAAPMFKKLSLELGGKNPNLIFADCDFEKMLRTTLQSSFANQGQICLCGSRILVERPLYDRFVAEFVQRVKTLQVGRPEDPATQVGAVVSKDHQAKILHYIQLAQEEGGTVQCGGHAVQVEGLEGGFYVAPTVITGLSMHCRTNQEEIFGPVVTIQAFDTVEEGLSLANATKYGLAATVWTQNLRRAHHVASEVHCGIVWVNNWLVRDLRTPFGGVKASGIGREGGFEALRFFTEPKNIYIDLG
ncbi:MAG TPA: 2-hydroxymuconic semialdehyde dehydrogenase [Cryomorphaceae bacterium]|jgi:aminomuconate-semialdehyde/2-hydroxymuconate-6-semialdehyde dehydrogenase|nr:MAG: 2-hydroxymuconic semialdehyde dehydrogenase [Cryomorphaceae bacterium BACL7 MAG-120910-bin2]KRO68692.1 MAG: 2-hydroxymuconic semialdehyde dehydrogenase [Cryomorphaceae bacterium BACL7 MAG-120322-bin74]KRO83314.1 MAG: 2-hydroxymuconic semialdehyde dehydrogenase [Cryomorphaceae bacterium BACL7 MAG-121220-bin83]HAB31129.1 2-hydroxymuconic semialdehyde dehydrogenase [Cryomorphaceae bacterium]HAG49486.1 2-hydroxymuconic semialdehyde dehydrogenase [Cryomorphaceae bacterium]